MHRRPLFRHVARTVACATALTAVRRRGLRHAAGRGRRCHASRTRSERSSASNRTLDSDRWKPALGRPLDRVVTMTANNSPAGMRSSVWGQFASSSAYLPALSDRLDVTVTIPLAFGKKAPYQRGGPAEVLKGLKKTVSGAYDADFRTVARTLIAAGYSDAVLRLGHEFDGTWVQWSARDNEQGYIDAFRHVRNVFEQESKAFRYEWTGMNAPWRAHARGAYPGDAYVDIIGLDIYYRSPGQISDKVWNRYKATLEAHRDFAIERGKPVSYPEWGRAHYDTGRFIGLMHDWFTDLPASGPGSLEYQSYFNPPTRAASTTSTGCPTVKRRYVQHVPNHCNWVQPAARAPRPAPLETPAPPSTTIAVRLRRPPAFRLRRLRRYRRRRQPRVRGSPSWPRTLARSRLARHRRRTAQCPVSGGWRTNRWKWVRWKAPITGLRSGTAYEVQARIHSGEAWQPWMTATATTK